MERTAPPRRLLLAIVLLLLLGIALALILASRPQPTPVLHIRASSWCSAGAGATLSPCPVETWIGETSGAVRERQTVQRATMDQIYIPVHGGWRVVSRVSTTKGGWGKWTQPSDTTLPLPYPHSLAALRAAMRGLEKSTPAPQHTVVRGRPALAVTVPEGDLTLPWPLNTAITVYIDRATDLPLRFTDQNGKAVDVTVEAQTTADLPDGFLSLPGQQSGTLLDRVLDYVRRLHL